MSQEMRIIGAWRNEEIAVLVTDCPIGRIMIEEIAHGGMMLLNFIIWQGINLHDVFHGTENIATDGTANPIITVPLSVAGPIVASLPLEAFTVVGTEFGHLGIDPLPDDDAALVELAAMLADIERKGLPADPEELTHE